MIKDKLFKSLRHSYKGFDTLHNGQELEPGYKPDYVLINKNEYIILESENSSSRKTYVGGLIKAAHYLQNDKKGKLIFVIVPKKNTKASSIANHLKPYLKWIQASTNLNEVYVIEAKSYYSDGHVLALDCKDFLSCALKVQS
jgi:hypothetical protein